MPVHIQHVKNKQEKSELQMSRWIVDYFVIELDDKAVCLLHSETVIVLKEYKHVLISAQAFIALFQTQREKKKKSGNLEILK